MAGNAQTFIDALHHLEETRETGPIAGLFADDADVSNPLVKHAGEGTAGADAFWTSYRAAFEDIRSEFRNVVEEDDLVILEWTSTGATKGGDFTYGGVSVIEYGEGGITAFRSYFDPAVIGRTLS